MFKKIVLFTFMFLPFTFAFSQEQLKIAYVSTDEVFPVMPETEVMKTQLDKMAKQYKEEEQNNNNEYIRKLTLFQQQRDSLPESIANRRMTELQEMQERLSLSQQQMNEEYQKTYQQLLTPIQKKVMDAIKALGDEHGYTFILDKTQFLYVAPNAMNATPLLKKKLGLPDIPAAPNSAAPKK